MKAEILTKHTKICFGQFMKVKLRKAFPMVSVESFTDTVKNNTPVILKTIKNGAMEYKLQKMQKYRKEFGKEMIKWLNQ